MFYIETNGDVIGSKKIHLVASFEAVVNEGDNRRKEIDPNRSYIVTAGVNTTILGSPGSWKSEDLYVDLPYEVLRSALIKSARESIPLNVTPEGVAAIRRLHNIPT